MSAFVRRYRSMPSIETLTAIEQVALIDRDPRTPTTGVGTGTLMITGEFEDGPFNTPTEVFGDESEAALFGGFGYQYGTLRYQNPCARRHLTEDWNGNGFLKGKFLRPLRKVICRVDSSVGDVRFTLAAALRSDPGPFAMAAADQLSVTTDTGGPANSTAVTAAAATVAGGGFVSPTLFVGGERISITVDALPAVTVTFQAADQLVADVIARINATLGYTAAVLNGAELDLTAIQVGSGGSLTLADIDAGTLAQIGHAAAITAGTGNVADAAAVTAAEAANLINSAAITAINGVAVVDAATQEVIVYRNGSAAGTISMLDVAGAMATDMGFTVGTTITGNIGDAFTIAAGTRVRNAGGDEWVTMRTLSIPEGTAAALNEGTIDVEVRDATDDGSGTGAVAGTVTTLVDTPSARMVTVSNPANLTVALTEPQLDTAYTTALAATLDPSTVALVVTESVSARRSTTVTRQGRANAIQASDEGNFGRHFYARSALGSTSAAALLDVINWRHDRVFYSWLGWRITVPEIAAIGTAGGTGFTADGEITIGADGPLAYINSVLNPEENPGQDTQLLEIFINGLEETTETLNVALYTALKAAGICNPRVDTSGNFVYQSEVTTDLTAGRTTQKRRKMADFLQDSFAAIQLPESKKLATDSRNAAIDGNYESFLGGLLSDANPDFQRIAAYSVQDTTSENPDLAALGITIRKVQVQMLASLDTMVVDTEIGEGVVVVREAA